MTTFGPPSPFKTLTRGDGTTVTWKRYTTGADGDLGYTVAVKRGTEAHASAVATWQRPGTRYFTPAEFRYMRDHWSTGQTANGIMVDVHGMIAAFDALATPPADR